MSSSTQTSGFILHTISIKVPIAWHYSIYSWSLMKERMHFNPVQFRFRLQLLSYYYFVFLSERTAATVFKWFLYHWKEAQLWYNTLLILSSPVNRYHFNRLSHTRITYSDVKESGKSINIYVYRFIIIENTLKLIRCCKSLLHNPTISRLSRKGVEFTKVLGGSSSLESQHPRREAECRWIACRTPVNHRDVLASTNKTAYRRRAKVTDNEPRSSSGSDLIEDDSHGISARHTIGRENDRSARLDRAIIRHHLHRARYSRVTCPCCPYIQ